MIIKNNIAISESGFIFHPNTGESFSLNPMGVDIFKMIYDKKSYEEIRDQILSIYDVEESIFEKDYQDFTSLLSQYQIAGNENAG